MRRYCKKTIRKIKHTKEDSGHREVNSRQKTDCGISVAVPVKLVNLLKMKAFREKLKAAEMEFHDPQHCRSCQVKQAELAHDDFIRRKMTQLQSPLLEGKIQSHWLNRNSICLIGEAVRELPRPTDNPSVVWQALKAREEELAGHKETPTDLASPRVQWDLASDFDVDMGLEGKTAKDIF
ncbi:hypothetical protein ACEWY4_027287 [Coilia grayii]|uniref:Uncharacterized protein n=1 Tax=Coilia grayii TaxID=363190 RepID=A0ABD1IS04_9TELE